MLSSFFISAVLAVVLRETLTSLSVQSVNNLLLNSVSLLDERWYLLVCSLLTIQYTEATGVRSELRRGCRPAVQVKIQIDCLTWSHYVLC